MDEHFSVFFGQGRALIANTLSAHDPFALSPAEIVQRVLEAGYAAMVFHPRHDRWPAPGKVTLVRRNGQLFLVAVDAVDEILSVQEVREGLNTAAPLEDGLSRQIFRSSAFCSDVPHLTALAALWPANDNALVITLVESFPMMLAISRLLLPNDAALPGPCRSTSTASPLAPP